MPDNTFSLSGETNDEVLKELKIYGETPDCHDYTYDYRNFLVNDNGTAYEYDGNGNITKKGTTTFTYDTVIKDRLVKVGNTPVTYSTENPLNPATYGNCSYNFKGRRLQSFTKSGSTYNYIYDEQGLRTRKIAPDGSVTKYLYNGTKLAAEIAPNYRLDFLYDENDMLYGFVKDGSAKYFYARDMLQNILGIIDTNGSPVVIYQYTAYGTSTVLQDTAGLANINPFRFKGYYFDSESGMYYCHTRYYVPEWCRWLTHIHTKYSLDLQNANFFTYCFSNPVNYICYDGTKPRKPNFIPRKPQRKGAEKRQPTGSRERNVGHPNGEEHSRVPKGNKGVRHSIFWLNASYSQWNPIENTKITLMENFSINNYENFSMSKNNQEDSSFTTLSVNDYQPFRANNKSSTDDSMLWLAIGASILIIAALCLVPLTGGQSLWLMIAL